MRTTVTRIGLGLALAAAAALAGCGSGGGGSTGGHPDTGYGALQTIPPTENCTAYCQRQVDCSVDLCDEDIGTTSEQQFQYIELNGCEALCTDALIQTNIPSAAWSCLFTDSCRQVFGENSCHVTNASYSCMAN